MMKAKAKAKRPKVWVRVKKLTAAEKAAIAVRCDAFITQTLIPRFLPKIRPSQFNYPVGIHGKWRGRQYSFITRYRSGFPENSGEEFDMAHARLDHLEEETGDALFDVMWHRHNGQWWRLDAAKTLEEALRLIETEELLWPL
jgi:hypothetical protein